MVFNWNKIDGLYKDLKNITDEDKNAVLIWASGYVEVVKYLAEECGVDVDVRANNDYAVQFASQNGYISKWLNIL